MHDQKKRPRERDKRGKDSDNKKEEKEPKGGEEPRDRTKPRAPKEEDKAARRKLRGKKERMENEQRPVYAIEIRLEKSCGASGRRSCGRVKVRCDRVQKLNASQDGPRRVTNERRRDPLGKVEAGCGFGRWDAALKRCAIY